VKQKGKVATMPTTLPLEAAKHLHESDHPGQQPCLKASSEGENNVLPSVLTMPIRGRGIRYSWLSAL